MNRLFIIIAGLWSITIIVNVIRDICHSDKNYYGVFFALLIALVMLISGNGVIAGLYFLLNRLLKK